jgi:6-phosphogluconolactonase/glucosamine-6-phosphate isomerase/deaminase
MTAGLAVVRSAQLGIVLALGDGKRQAWERMLKEEIDLDECPAVLVRQLPEAMVVTDLV